MIPGCLSRRRAKVRNASQRGRLRRRRRANAPDGREPDREGEVMKTLATVLLVLMSFVPPALADPPVAVVEDVSGKPAGVEFMDYVDAGQGDQAGVRATSIVLGYLKSCWRETIRGGTVTVGAEQSEVSGGSVDRAKVACDGGKMELAAAQSKQSAAMVFRTGSPAATRHPATVQDLRPFARRRAQGRRRAGHRARRRRRRPDGHRPGTRASWCTAPSTTSPRPTRA